MGLDVYFVYEVEDKTGLEVPGTVCRGLQDLFEFPSRSPELQNSILNPVFVQDFPKPEASEPCDIDFAALTEEEWEELLEPYVGPSFDPDELVVWAKAWLNILAGVNEQQRRLLLPLASQGYDWTPVLFEDLKQIAEQGECAQRHEIKMHIEMY